MQILCSDYQFQMISIISGALGYRPKCLNSYMYDLSFNDKEIKINLNKMQCLISSGTVKICYED